MASLAACISRLAEAGLLDREQAELLREEAEAAVRAGVENPEVLAVQNARASLERQRFLTELQAAKIAEVVGQAEAHPEGIARGVQAVLARDVTAKAGYSNVDQRRNAVMRAFTSRMGEAMDALRIRAGGLTQDKALMEQIVRELFGESTGDSRVGRFAKQIAETMEEARARFNRAGGDIPKRDDWGLPQRHDSRRVGDMGKDNWKAFIRPLLAPERMLGQNGLPMTPEALDEALDAAYETIVTHGLNKLVPGQGGGRKLANRHQDHRFLVFKDADAWLAYDRQLGGGNPYLTIMQHLENMAGDIALLEILGPNPTQAFRVLYDTAKKGGVEGLDLNMTQAMWETVSGAGNGTATLKLSTIENLAAARNWLTSMKLGSAMLSAASDIAFFRHASAWNGLSTTRAISQFLSLLNPGNSADRLRAVQMGLTAEAWSSLALHANRFSEVTGTGLSAHAADITMRLSGLSHWTDSAQKAIGLEFLTRMAELRALPWDRVPVENRRLLEEVGFGADDWNVLRAQPLDEWKGVAQIDLRELSRSTDPQALRVANKTMEAIQTLSGLAVPAPDARVRAIGSVAGERGTVTREIAHSVLQFKSFPMAVILSHGYRGMHMGSMGGRGAYFGSLVVATTTMGALAVQLKEISQGRTPRDMTDPTFWSSAFFQGGGAGIFGDFLYSGMFGVNRFGGSIAETLAGPGAGAVTDLMRITAGQLGEVVEGKDTKIGSDVVQAMSRYTPVIGSLWYTRLAYERLVLNQLQLQVDPDARQKWRQEARRREKQAGTEYWWKKGEAAP